ncbi:VOC family protein [Rubellimicrobium roseum]|uniref:Lactoylglutathione lyase n=1 Tax=Rubellimicrobium roseum TaxID=687525 RepID=A0A5C4NCG9_9RHOB|nr:lactoylglutathione lyase [Rubellimicrobium roseum]TNC64908.1 lactoylglutathione lyase [Rubellimicrobium roseum]
MTAHTTAPAQPQMIFVNLPSTDIARARAFYAGLGFPFDERFCNSDSLMVGVSDTIHLMILDREKFASFSPCPVAPGGTVGALVCLSQPSAASVDAFVTRALVHGGRDNNKTQEAGDFMYGRSVCDPDGNVLEIMWMDVDRALKAWGMAA